MWDMQEPELSPFDKALLDSNKVGAKTLSDLSKLEKALTLATIRDYHKEPVEGHFDYDHLKAIHERLFGDIYTFAGKDRHEMGLTDKPFQKVGDATFGDAMFVHGSQLPKVARELFEKLQKKNLLKDLPQNSFARESATFFGELNMLHPFREGNGRTQRLFMESLAKNAGYNLSLDKIPGDKMITACQEANRGFNARMEILFKQNLEPINLTKEKTLSR